MEYDPAQWAPVRRPDRVTEYERSVFLPRSREDVFAFCCDGANLPRIYPGKISANRGTDETVVKPNHVYAFTHWMMRVIPVRWVVHIVEYETDQQYVDLQLRGPFRYFRHTHRCDEAENGTKYSDRVEFKSLLGSHVDRVVMRPMFSRIFTYRQNKMVELLSPAEHGH